MNTIKDDGREYVIERDSSGYGALLAERRLMLNELVQSSLVFAIIMVALAAVIWWC